MSPPTFGASVVHASHKPERKPMLERVLRGLGDMPVYVEARKVEETDATWRIWSERQWTEGWALAKRVGASHVLFLNDDVTLCESFPEILACAIAERPAHIVALYQEHPLAYHADQRGMRWVTGRDSLLGPAYVLPTDAVARLLEWREHALIEGGTKLLTEDQLLNLWAMAQGSLIWHTVPALVDHDTSADSCYGNRKHNARVPPRSPMPVNWDTDAAHMGHVFVGNHWHLLSCVRPDKWKESGLIEKAYEIHADADPLAVEAITKRREETWGR